MDIYEVLKSKDNDIRLTNDALYRWLVWQDTADRWAVWERKPYARESGCLYFGNSCDEAIQTLIKEVENGRRS